MIDRLIGKVKEVDTENWDIKFDVPNLFKDISTYPVAHPLFAPCQEVLEDDNVCIFYNSATKDAFYYVQINRSNFLGLFNESVEVDLTDGEKVKINSKSGIELDGSDNHLVMWEPLKDALDQFMNQLCQALDNWQMQFNLGWNSTYGQMTKGPMPSSFNEPTSIDISNAKAKSLMTSGDATPRES